jgi:hypothetical protein
MTEILCLTRESSYRGEVDLSRHDGQEMRLLDALNNPQRIARSLGNTRSLVLLGKAMRQGRSGAWAIPCAGDTWLDPDRILLAHEVPLQVRSRAAAGYEGRAGLYTVRVQLHLDGGYLAEGDVLSRSPSARHLRDRAVFIACTRVRVRDLELAGLPVELPFAAVNLDRVESFGVLGVIKNFRQAGPAAGSVDLARGA